MAEQPGWEYPRMQVRIYQALCAADAETAAPYLLEALRLARPVRAMRDFIDLGMPMFDLLSRLHTKMDAELQEFAHELLLSFETAPRAVGTASLPAGEKLVQLLIEPLSERELEVLALIADGLSNDEIAKRLYLSPNTLKAHTQNIYSKLDVHSRVQAVNKARDIGILVG